MVLRRSASPRISGLALRALAAAVRTAPGALAARALFRRDLGIDKLDRLPESWRGAIPLDNVPVAGRPPRQLHDAELAALAPGDWPRTSASITRAIRAGLVTPQEIGARALAGARGFGAQTPSMSPLLAHDDAGVERDARASAERYRRGAPLGPLDGVPVVIKEESAMAGFPQRLGTACLPTEPVLADATAVMRLRRAGALVLGPAPMTEYGMTPVGVNPHRKMPRNPHRLDRLPGGSSTGSAVAVAEGLVPLALGADGGGSIRIPACLNGVFGLKPSWGRVSRAGDGFGGSLNHLGPLGASAADLAFFLDAVAGPDEADPASLLAPPFEPGALLRSLGRGVRGLRIGVIESEWEDASSAVSASGREALAALEREGATLVPLKFEFARYAAAVGFLLIALECFADTRAVRLEHGGELSHDLQITFATTATLSASDIGDALRLRAGLRTAVAGLLRDVDALALPTTAIAAPLVTDEQARLGFVDPGVLGGLCRFAFLANLTGLPASTSPVGVDEDGMPVGLQMIGDAFDEETVLAITSHLERCGAARVRKPRVSVDLLNGS